MKVVLETRVDTFRGALTGQRAADVEPLRIVLKPDASMEHVRARPRQVAPEKMEWLESRMQLLSAAENVGLNRHATCAIVAMVVPKGQGFRIVADYRGEHAQVELVTLPMSNLQVVSVRLGMPLLPVLWTCWRDSSRCRWPRRTQDLFALILPSGLSMPTRVPQGMVNADRCRK